MENPIKMDDLGVPLFFGNIHILILTIRSFYLLFGITRNHFQETQALQGISTCLQRFLVTHLVGRHLGRHEDSTSRERPYKAPGFGLNTPKTPWKRNDTTFQNAGYVNKKSVEHVELKWN